MSEHSQQPTMSPVMASVEQEEALNAEREAREARTRARCRTYSEMMDRKDITNHEEPPPKKNTPNAFKNVARCGICLEWFSDHTTMLTHLQTHSDNYTCKNFICHICKKSFKEKWQLFRHEMSHKRNESVPMYICSVCNKSFADKNAYKTHQKTHIVDKTYHCSKCNKIFFKEVTLLTHQCTTEGLFGKKGVTAKSSQRSGSLGSGKKYKCSKCNATFSSFQSKNSHMRVHTEGSHSVVQKDEIKIESEDESMPKLSPEAALEYSMAIEPKVEINEESAPPPLKRTLIKTTGGYRCGVCQSPFVLRELAVAHLRSAHPLMPYQCPYCKKRFTTQYTFTHHIKSDHPDEHEN
ncbi:Zinc finger protein Xfin [Dufourea novaeangliae]|uniref:Zinc finger protein Xfin n=2 Tax=Dufourea novaeangliae TaxID=178035 RepID=A0A154P6U8_DUFNO|nr:Zinc finger protein Xfin [Dufourea novaeangliae]